MGFSSRARFTARAPAPAQLLPAALANPAGAIVAGARRDPAAAERRIVLFRHVGLLESYFDGELDLEGDLRGALATGMGGDFAQPNRPVALRNRWHERRFSNASAQQAKANARFHYALGTPFYRLWLDEALMMYTCAYWKEGTRTREQAQQNKIDHVCAKLRLAPGEEVVDIGSGFGGFMFRAHQPCGVRVTGINTTTEQVTMVRDAIARRGLGGPHRGERAAGAVHP